MNLNSPILFIEINKLEFIFGVGELDESSGFKLLYNQTTPIEGIVDDKIIELERILEILKKGIYSIEQKLNLNFKNIILVLDNFDKFCINLTGFKKLNGSQLLKENISYIINSLKSNLSEIENKKSLIHIFNSKYSLDNKNIENLPVGLFGDFYTHELSFFLINTNDHKNLTNIFEKLNLKIERVLSKSYIDGVNLINMNKNKPLKNFFNLEIRDNYSKLFYFENDALKYIQSFAFGSEIIINDISKIVSIRKSNLRKLIKKNIFKDNISENELIEKEYFDDSIYRKVKKKLVLDIADARIQEMSEIILIKNVNLKNFLRNDTTLFIKIIDDDIYISFKDIIEKSFSCEKKLIIKFTKSITIEETFKTASNIVQFGWKKEALPIIQIKKSILARFFDIF